MKISSVSASFLLCLGSVVSKKHGLRALSMSESGRECMEYFNDMDIDQDDELSFTDIKTMVVYLINEAGVGEDEVREFADDLTSADVNNDGKISHLEFMNSCDMDNDDVKVKKTKVISKNAKIALLNAAEKVVAQQEKDEENLALFNAAEEVAAATVEDEAAATEQNDYEMVIHTYSKEDVEECKGFFKKMDIDKDGVLSLEDLGTVIDSKIKENVDETELRAFVDDLGAVDLNNDEIIDKNEFMSACLDN